MDVFKMKKGDIKRSIRESMPQKDWRWNVIVEILLCLDGQLNNGVSIHELKEILNHVCVL